MALQKLNGVEEPFERARTGWQAMTPRQKESTKAAYAVCIGKEW